MGGVLMSRVEFKKTAVSQVNVVRKIALSPVTSQKYPCRMSLMILAPMSHVEFKKGPCRPVDLKKRPCRAVDFSGPPPYNASNKNLYFSPSY